MKNRSLRALAFSLALLLVSSGAFAAPAKGELVITSRTVAISGKLNMKMVEQATQKLLEFDAISHDPIFLVVNAHGDAIEAAFALIDTIRALESPVHAVVQSRAYEAAAYVTAFCAKTWLYPRALLLFHPIESASTEFVPAREVPAEFLKGYREDVYAALAEATGLKKADFARKVESGWWLTAPQAVEAGLADDVVTKVAFRELFIEKTEIKKTVTTIEKKQRKPEGGKPELKKGHTR